MVEQPRQPDRKPAKVFISYRRSTGSGYALLIFDRLRRRLPDVFRDQNSLLPGEPFDAQLAEQVQRCDAMIVVVSPGWVEEFRNRSGQAEKDWLLEEIRIALAADKQIFTVLTDGVSANALKRLPPELDRLRDTQPSILYEKKYESVLDDLARRLWRWPPLLYWASSVVVLAAAIVFTFWCKTATEWGENWWSMASIAFFAWVIPTIVSLSGGVYPLLPGMGPLRGLGSSTKGLCLVTLSLVAAALSAVGWRTVAVKPGSNLSSATYRLNQGSTVWSRTVDSRSVDKYRFAVWSWSPLTVSDTEGNLGRCITEMPPPLTALTIEIPDGLVPTTVVIMADDALKRDLRDAEVQLAITPLFHDHTGETITRQPYEGEPVSLHFGPCSNPTGVEINWRNTEAGYAHIQRLGRRNPQRFTLSMGARGANQILLKGEQ